MDGGESGAVDDERVEWIGVVESGDEHEVELERGGGDDERGGAGDARGARARELGQGGDDGGIDEWGKGGRAFSGW